MIQVSNEFKKAIKEPERRIKGYVEVLYDLPSVTVTPSVNVTSTYTPTSEISNGVRVENLYGSLDYLPLDGSYLTMGTTNTNIGFISDELFEDLTTPTVTLSFSSTTVKGITLYFRENIPTNLTLNYSDSTSDTITNDKNIVQVIFDSPKTLTSVQVVINDMMYQDRKIYLMEIDLGVTQVYKDQDLIEFIVDEEVNKLVEEVPINETNIILNNMTDLFNPLNPQGIVPYLSENTLIKPYIGVLTENLGVEYVKMGEFYFDSYTNNADATTTLVGKNKLNKLNAKDITLGIAATNYGYFIDQSSSIYNRTFKGIIENSGLPITIGINNIQTTYLIHIKSLNMIDFIKKWSLYQNGIFFINRNNNAIVKSIDTNTINEITKNELINDASYKKLDKINTINIIRETKETNDTYGGNETTYKMFDDYQFVLEKSDSLVAIEKPTSHLMSNFVNVFSNVTSGEIVWDNGNFLIARVVGTVGATASLTSSWTSYYSSRNSKAIKKTVSTYTTNSVEKNTIEIYDELSVGSGLRYSNILNYAPSYEMSFEYNGDPSLEAGDYINVETPYGYKPLFIQKNRFVFDGGLTGSIEGVE